MQEIKNKVTIPPILRESWRHPKDAVQLAINTSPLGAYHIRSEYTKRYSYAIPCKEAIETVVRLSRGTVAEPLAGTGYWASILRNAGVSIAPSDIVGSYCNKYHQRRKWVRIAKLDVADAVPKGADVLLCWPPYEEGAGTVAISGMSVGTRLFYVGEGRGDACGDNAMFDLLDRDFVQIEAVMIPRFQGIHDRFVAYERERVSPIRLDIMYQRFMVGKMPVYSPVKLLVQKAIMAAEKQRQR